MPGATAKNTFCIEYYKQGQDKPKVLRRINKNGTLVSTIYYDEVRFYTDIRDAMEEGRLIMDLGYDVKIRKCNRLNENLFWLI